jgi:ABC-2 type transport system ATP-binding protein
MTSGSALRTEGLSKRYRKGWALRDGTVALPTGAVIALVGPNGAGKSRSSAGPPPGMSRRC